MSINPGDFTVSIRPTDKDIDFLECVIGDQLTVEIDFSNNSTTDPLYNLNAVISLPDGISYISASILETSNIIDSSFNNLISFINIKDLYELEQNFKFTFILQVDQLYRATNLPVQFNTILSGISISASCDTMVRGSLDVGNSVIPATSTITLSAHRFSGRFNAPAAYLKGGGVIPGDSIDATQIFNVSINLSNNSRSSSNINFSLNLANGIRYIGVWSASGTNAANFLNPIVSNVSSTQDHVKISFNAKTLSPGSKTILTFQVAIWNNYTVNGIENSGANISYGQTLLSTLSISGNASSYNEEYVLTPYEVNVFKTCSSPLTDVNVTNEFSLTYETSEYLSVNNVILTDILPDGMTYVSNNSLIIPTITPNADGTTNIVWGIGSLPPNYSGTISLFAKTNTNYNNNDFICSTDIITNTLVFDCIKDTTGFPITIHIYASLTIVSPVITKEVTNYYYADMTKKPFQVGTIGDYVSFLITYDATNVQAHQKDVVLYDYPPLNMIVTTIPDNIITTGDFPPTAIPAIMPDNGVIVPLGNLNGRTNFTIKFTLPITDGLEKGSIYNLCKLQLRNRVNNSTSLRDNALIYFGEPLLHITNSISNSDCIHNGTSLNYSITIGNNNDDNPVDYTTDAFNVLLTTTIPSIYTISSTPTVTGTGSFSPVQIANNIITLNILSLPPNGSLLITAPLTVDSPPIMGESYNLPSSITPSTSQQNLNSHRFEHGDYPLNDETNLTSCNANISKFYTQPINKLGDYYESTIVVTIPKGVLCYNNKIKDSTVTTDTSYLTDVTLNGVSATYSLSSNNLQVLLPATLDTTASPVYYTLQYNNRIMSANPVNYEDSRVIQCSLDWSNTLAYPEVYSKIATAPFTIFTPGISITKYQANITRGIAYDTLPIYAIDYDNIKYKLTAKNIGKAPAYNVVITDTIPNTLIYNNTTGGASSFNSSTKVLTITVPFISTDSSQDVIIDTTVANDANDTVATNTASLTYKANTNLPNFYGTTTSNMVNLVKDHIVITKYQRNVTAGDAFTTSEIRCIKDQSIQYKVTIKNTSSNSLSNISITDTFPSQFDFISFEPFNLGTLTVNGKIVTCSVSLLPTNATLEFIYTIKLSNDAFIRSSSKATIEYKFLGGLNIFTKDSNRVYVICSSLGRGYMVY